MIKRHSHLDPSSALRHQAITRSPKRDFCTAKSIVSVTSEALFAGADELEITHQGAQYRLRQTALGKLILTK
ncbi:hemin uptake protein HemP [Zwartia sp.]|uniref:hemin uptake protein HemP n=1 Tax=Zwartia sp. TaxID=2978004 RepID=UPI003BB0ED01